MYVRFSFDFIAVFRQRYIHKMEFGKNLRHEFCLEENATLVNHGSYGCVPRKVIDQQIRMIQERERNPEHWYRYTYDDRYTNACAKTAEFIGCHKENLILTENVTTGLNAVVKSLKWKDGDAILVTDHTYEAIQNLANYVAKENEGIDVIQMKIPLPIQQEDEIIQAYADVIDKHPEIKLAIIDHITSVSAITLPIKELVDVCHQKGVLVLIDGAHCPGQIKLDLEDLGADYYSGNMHKWAFCPRGCALLWVHPNHHDTVHPILTTAKIFHSRLQDRFSYQATRDPIPYFLAPDAIDFYQHLGGIKDIVAYNSKLADWAADMLCKAWKSTTLPIPKSMRAPCLILVGLPDTAITRQYQAEMKGHTCNKMMAKIQEKHLVYTSISFVSGQLWCRLSVQVYNCQDDYYRLRDAVLDIVGKE